MKREVIENLWRAQLVRLANAAPDLLANLQYVDGAAGISDPDLAALEPGDILDVRITVQGLRDIRAALAKVA